MVKLWLLILLLIPQLCFADVGGWFGQSLEQHNNVDNSTTPSNGQLMKYNSTTEQWEFNDLTTTFVPYTGATTNVNLGAYTITATSCTLTGSGTSEIPVLEVSTTLNIPHSTSLPATCSVGQVYQDSDGTSAGQFYICESANNWVAQGSGGSVSDAVYSASWDTVTTIAPSKNAVYDKIETLAGGHNAVTLDVNANTLLSLSTQELGLDTQVANLIFSGPGTGANAVPTFRALVDNDVPDTITVSSYSLTSHNHSGVYEPTDADLTAISALGFTSTSFLKKTAANTWALDTNTYLTAEVDGSTTNELPTAGTAIDVTGQQVDFDSTEVEATTWGAGGNASNIWTFNLSGTDPTVTFGSGLVTFGAGVTLTTGKNFIIGTTQWNSGDSIDGTKIASMTSAQLAGVVSDESGTDKVAFTTSPVFTTPNIGSATATSINGNTITTGTGVLTLGAGKTLTASNTLTLSGTDSTTISGTYSKSFVILSPVATDDYPIWRVPYALTIRAVHVQDLGGTNIVGQLTECDGNGINCAVVDSADITATANNNANDDGTLSNPSIDSGDYIGWATTSISGTPTSATITFDYTIN